MNTKINAVENESKQLIKIENQSSSLKTGVREAWEYFARNIY